MKTALVIIKRPCIVLPTLAKLANECYEENVFDWVCVIDLGEHKFRHKLKTDFLVRKDEADLPKLAIDLARMEGKCDRVIMANFGDRCEFGYKDKIKTNFVGMSHVADCEGNLLEDKAFIQKESFVCYSCTEPSTIGLDANLNIFIAKEATKIDLDHYNLDSK